LRASDGGDYDLIMPSSHTVDMLIKQGMVKQIDKRKLTFFKQLYPTLLGHYYDPANNYTIPYVWMVYGLAIDPCRLGSVPESSWRLIFDKQQILGKTAMIDDAREASLIAALYLFGKVDELDEDQLKQVEELLARQQEWVEAYTDLRADRILLSGAVPLVVVNSLDVAPAMRFKRCLRFLVPREGSFIDIDSFALPSGTRKDQLVYQFLNYLYRPDVLQRYTQKFNFFPAAWNVSTSYAGFPFNGPTPALLKDMHFFRSNVPAERFIKLWGALKS